MRREPAIPMGTTSSTVASAGARQPVSLRDLADVAPVYFLPDDAFVSAILIPCFERARHVRCMMGFFNSRSLQEIAAGLASFLQRRSGTFRLLISPHLTENDRRAMEEGTSLPSTVLERRLRELLGEARVDASALVRHTLACISYLLASGQLEIRVCYFRQALFHPKVWFFADGQDLLVAHGSSNMTHAGLAANYEHVSVERSWVEPSQRERVQEFSGEFDALWQGQRRGAVTLPISEAARRDLLVVMKDSPVPTPEQFLALWREERLHERAQEGGSSEPDPARALSQPFKIPSHLELYSGDFAHQGRAVSAWIAAGYRGILEMATGSGKTIAALAGAFFLRQEVERLLIVVAAPYLPLVAQWEAEARAFGLSPVLPGRQSDRARKLATIDEVLRRLALGASSVECLIVTHDLLCDPEFQALIGREVNTLLIADEAHNLGREQFLRSPPSAIRFRLGLSATPVRQYDDVGTAGLFNYFGEVVFRFTLEDAIGVCLVPYSYYVHLVPLTTDEYEEWARLTRKLRSLGWMREDDSAGDGLIESLLRQRRLVVEAAEGKVATLERLLRAIPPSAVRRTLIYASDKRPEQLDEVNACCARLNLLFHQITADETSERELVEQLLDGFRRGALQALTAKRVLDEGVNIPEVECAYILASTTVERQWVQRRGRVLRKCSATGKSTAEIHDFLVVPPGDLAKVPAEARPLVASELQRIMAFAKIARNAASPGGALETIMPLFHAVFGH